MIRDAVAVDPIVMTLGPRPQRNVVYEVTADGVWSRIHASARTAISWVSERTARLQRWPGRRDGSRRICESVGQGAGPAPVELGHGGGRGPVVEVETAQPLLAAAAGVGA